MEKNEIILYSTGCPKCRVLKYKLDEKKISYTENKSIEDMLKLGINEAPILKVNDALLNFYQAINYVNNI